MGRLVNVYYMDKEALLTNKAHTDEESIVFNRSPSYDDLVAKVRHVVEWMDPNDGVKLIGRYDVGVGVKSRLKSMPITSNLHWDVYKEQVEKSDDKSIELFATKVEPPRTEIDLNRLVSSPMTDMTSVPSVEQRIMIDASNAYSQPESEDGDVDCDFDEVEEGFHGIDIGDLYAYIAQKEMDRMSSSGSMMSLSCADQWDMPKKWMADELDKVKEKDVPTRSCCLLHLFNESLAHEEERERREKEKKEKKNREEEKKRKEKEARQEERETKLARARDAKAQDEARDKKGKWRRTTQ
ncbi:hypothetical protein D1007_00644 [Hordeum vulgare]|nr:hypothetical protein D1007_00644 [Hordeum vulgare]